MFCIGNLFYAIAVSEFGEFVDEFDQDLISKVSVKCKHIALDKSAETLVLLKSMLIKKPRRHAHQTRMLAVAMAIIM